MEKVLYSEIAIICVIILMVVWINDIRKSRGPLLLGQKIFRILLWINVAAIVFDLVQVLFDGTTYWYSHFVEKTFILLFYLMYALLAYVFTLYADYELYPDNKRFKKRAIIYSFPAIAMAVMCVCSIWTGWYFVIDDTNTYIRGNIFYIPTMISFGYIFYILCLLGKYKKENMLETRAQRDLYYRLFVFPLTPCLGAILQILMQGTAWIFPGTTLAILINYIAMQNGYMARDYLTGLYNRSQLEEFLNYELKNIKKGNYFFLILLDMDKFKQINDTYGHVVGDEALIQAAKLLRGNCKRKSDYVARLGGDEFVIIGQCEDKEAVDMIIKRMHDVANEFNEKNKVPYKILFSAGYVIYDGSTHATLDTLLSEADQRMYEVKKAKKANENQK